MFKITSDILFATSVAKGSIHDYNRKSLIQTILDLEKTDGTNKRSNAGGWQSFHKDNTNFDNIYAEELFQNHIIPILHSVADSWGFPQTPYVSYWYNINRRGNYNHSHYHPLAPLSGVFYLKIPNDSGRIVFTRADSESDRMDYLTQWQIDNGVDLSGNINCNVIYEAIPEEDMILIFPGHLEHYVTQNNTTDQDDARISISFNYFLS